jgi:hypothetical protein
MSCSKLVLLAACVAALVPGAAAVGDAAKRDLLVPRRAGGSVAAEVNTPSGMQAEVSQRLLDYGATIINSVIQTELAKVQIPEISGKQDGFDYDVKNCHVSASINTPSASFVAGQGLSLALNNVDLNAHCDWSYKLHDWPHVPDGSGSLDAKAGGGTSISATVDAAVVGGKVVLTVASCKVDIDDFDVTVHGSIFSWLCE